MQEVYMRPNLEIISFEPQKTIAAGWNPDWGYEDDVFSTPETRNLDDEDAGRRQNNEG